MLHESHAAVARPALLVVVAHDVLVVRVGVLGQVALNQIPRRFRVKLEQNEHLFRTSKV